MLTSHCIPFGFNFYLSWLICNKLISDFHLKLLLLLHLMVEANYRMQMLPIIFFIQVYRKVDIISRVTLLPKWWSIIKAQCTTMQCVICFGRSRNCSGNSIFLSLKNSRYCHQALGLLFYSEVCNPLLDNGFLVFCLFIYWGILTLPSIPLDDAGGNSKGYIKTWGEVGLIKSLHI